MKRLIVVLCLLLMTTGCGGDFKVSATEQSVAEQAMQSGSYYYEKLDVIYGLGFDNETGKMQVVKRSPLSGEYTPLVKAEGLLNITGKEDYIYFTTGKGVYRVNAFTNDLEKLADCHREWGCKLQIQYKKIFYNDDALYKMDLDGANREVVIDKNIDYWHVFEDAVTYQDEDYELKYHVYFMESGNDRIIIDEPCYDIINGEDDYYYYIKNVSDDLMDISRKQENGGVEVVYSAKSIANLRMQGDYLYFTQPDDGDLYRIPREGGKKEVVLYGYVKEYCFYQDGLIALMANNQDRLIDDVVYLDFTDNSTTTMYYKLRQ